jgi:plasmid stability protein
MAALVIKNIPEDLHKRLKQEARKHRRSMTQEALIILEERLNIAPIRFPDPVKGTSHLTQELLEDAIREGRE